MCGRGGGSKRRITQEMQEAGIDVLAAQTSSSNTALDWRGGVLCQTITFGRLRLDHRVDVVVACLEERWTPNMVLIMML